MTTKLYAPKVYLFAFHLFKTPDVDGKTSIKDPELLWDKCHDIFAKFHIKEQLNLHPSQPYNDRFNLLDGAKPNDFVLPIHTEISYKNADLKLEGFAYPLQLYDSYGLGLNLGCPDPPLNNGQKIQPVDSSVLEALNPDYCFLPDTIQSYFGQTVIITALLSDNQKRQGDKFLEDLANECIREFAYDPHKRPELYRKGQLFGSPIFEYGLISTPDTYRHILVWLFADPVTDTKFQEGYQLLLDLFFYRNKVITEFRHSRDTYTDAYQAYKHIQHLIRQTFNQLPQTTDTLDEESLKYLKGQLKEMAKQTVEYSDLLRDLESRRNSIAINADNYKTKLQLIRNKFTLDKDKDISFLTSFYLENCQVFQEQIQGDLGYFVPGANLLEKAISSIRGIVEIDQAQRDRIREDQDKTREQEEKDRDYRLERTIQVLGIGLGTGGLVASSFNHIDKPLLPPFSTNKPHPVISTFFWSVLAALLAGLATWWITKKKTKT